MWCTVADWAERSSCKTDDTIQCIKWQYSTIQANTIEDITMQYNTIEDNKIKYKTMQYNTTNIERAQPVGRHFLPSKFRLAT